MPLTKSLTSLMCACTLIFGLVAASPLRAQGLGGPKTRADAARQQPDVGRPLIGYPGQDIKLMDGKDTVRSNWQVGDKEYFAQPNDWTCSASCYLMMFRTLVKADITLQQAIERCGAQPEVGAPNEQVVSAFRMLGPRFEVVSGLASQRDDDIETSAEEKSAELATLKKLLEDGYLVMINFREPEEQIGHYAVLQGLNERAIELADPYYGRRSVLTLDKFDYRSGFSKPVLHGWYLAVRQTDPGGRGR